ncbi:endonuclease domain-containing protein [Paradevosia shaoguanensis]|nr:endonuclease domain-containing protein [Paradevosia shaoguanensis]
MLEPFRTGGYHFRKQVPIGPYYADMACHHAQLVIEVDGDTHFDDRGLRHDAARDAFLSREGYTVLRFTNLEVLRNPDGVYDVVSTYLAGRPKSPKYLATPSLALPTRGRVERVAGSTPNAESGSPAELSQPAPTLPRVGRAREGESLKLKP